MSLPLALAFMLAACGSPDPARSPAHLSNGPAPPASDAGHAALSSAQFCELVDQVTEAEVERVRAADARTDLTPEGARGALLEATPRGAGAAILLRSISAGYGWDAVGVFTHDFASDAETCLQRMTQRLKTVEPALMRLAAIAQKVDPPRLSPAWRTDLDAAMAGARAAGRPVLLRFYAAWNGADTELDKTTFADPGVVAELGRFVAIRVDATDDDAPGLAATKKKYGVVGLPTLILLDGQGHETRRIGEFITAPKLRAFLSEVTASTARQSAL